MLGKRERLGEHEAMRKIKNEFMSMWDGLKTKEGERVLVLAATNRPFDLDDAVLRRLPRRMLVDLPDAENREKILRVILAKENMSPDFPFAELARVTEGFSGSDLKNLCISAAFVPIREILNAEKKEKERLEKEQKEKDSKGKEEDGASSDDLSTSSTSSMNLESSDSSANLSTSSVTTPSPSKGPVTLRPLTFADFEKAKKEVRASVSEDAFAIAELRKWNEMYGEGGVKTHTSLSYFN